METWLTQLASEVLGCENIKDQADAADGIADKLDELGFKASAEEVRKEAIGWLEQAGYGIGEEEG